MKKYEVYIKYEKSFEVNAENAEQAKEKVNNNKGICTSEIMECSVEEWEVFEKRMCYDFLKENTPKIS